ncbi:MAG: response regulator [Anaerolineales bacterium]|nr:response regulator [Anaerolineales bacterium]
MAKTKIRARILSIIAVVMPSILLSVSAGIAWINQNRLKETFQEEIIAIQPFFDFELSEDAELMRGLLDFIEIDQGIQSTWSKKDREGLLNQTSLLFENIQTKYYVTHFYFHDLDRVNFLRVHNPPRYGDFIDRYTMTAAFENERFEYGIELGPYGTFTLRAVKPWYFDGVLEGYIELGKEIEHITPHLSETLGVELIFLIDKTLLNREQWEEGLRMMEREGDWDQLANYVVIDQTIDIEMTQISAIINNQGEERKENDDTLRVEDQLYWISTIPLNDAGENEVGQILILKNNTQAVTELKTLITYLASGAIVLGSLLFGFFWFYLGRVEDDIEASFLERIKIEDQLIESELSYRSIFDGVNDAILVETSSGEVLDVNVRACEMYGWPREEFLTKTLQDMVPPDARALIPENQVEDTFETINIRANGERFPVAITGQLQTINDQQRLLIVVRDITSQKERENELRLAIEAAEVADQTKSEFLANMSHEIRTPLNGVLGMIELSLDTDLTAEQRDFLQTARSSADSLLRVINDILDFSKIEAGHLELDLIDFDLLNAVESVAQTMANRASAKGLELVSLIEPDLPATLRGDPGRLKQVLVNLTGNAIKFTEEGEINIRVQQEEEDQGQVKLKFMVRDTGIGIPEGKLRSIFERFQQVDGSSTRKASGTGLGLAISQQLVMMMGGEIGVESELGLGSTFWFTVTFEKQMLERPKTIPIPLRGVRILGIDDNHTNRLLLKKTLEKAYARIDVLDNGLETVTELKKAKEEGDPYRIVLLDMQMPVFDGEQTLEEIKASDVGKKIEVIILTSVRMLGDIERLKGKGCAGYLVKPVKQRQLVDVIEMVLGQQEQEVVSKQLFTKHHVRNQKQDKIRILLAEDNLVNQKLAVALLEKANYSVEVVKNGVQAVDAIQEKEYSLVLMDIQMPEMDGFEATRIIRENEKELQHIPIIALTAHAMKGDRERCLEAGMDDYLSKPLAQKELYRLIEKWSKGV